MLTDTIVAQATPAGTAALAVVRLSGSNALGIARSAVRPAGRLASLSSHSCLAGRIVDGDETVDHVVVTVFRAPRSYTGEDVVEISCHGGPGVVSRVIGLLLRAGARPAREGEFTQRAFLNGKMDLAQAEAVAGLIAARSAAGARAAVRVLGGALTRVLEACIESITEARAQLEATLDIHEDGSADVIVPSEPAEPTLHELLAREEERLGLLRAGNRAGRLLEEGARVVLAGKPNAGKSSIFNALLARDRAIVSPQPGTTRDTLEAWVDWGGLDIALWDTAGLGACSSPIDREGARRTREALEGATLVALVLDVSGEAVDGLAEVLSATDLPVGRTLVALHKWDLGPSAEWQRLEKQGCIADPRVGAKSPVEQQGLEVAADGSTDDESIPVIATSVLGHPGVEPLKRAIADRLRADTDAPSACAVGDRQRGLLKRAHEAVHRARVLIEQGEGGELVAFELREAAGALGTILGRNPDPAVLERIFSRFCVGK